MFFKQHEAKKKINFTFIVKKLTKIHNFLNNKILHY